MDKFFVIGSNPKVLKEVQNWASKKQYNVECYTDREWNEIEKKVVPIRPYLLPAGASPSGTVSLKEIESQTISSVLMSVKGNISKVSQILKVGRATLYRKIKEYNIDLEKIRYEESKENQKIKIA